MWILGGFEGKVVEAELRFVWINYSRLDVVWESSKVCS